jgi:hypothetical protein
MSTRVPSESPLAGLFHPGIEYPNNLENRMRQLKVATGGLDIYVRALDEDGTEYMAGADSCDGEGGWHTVATGYAHSSVAALDKLIAKLGFTGTDDGRLVRTGKLATQAATAEAA